MIVFHLSHKYENPHTQKDRLLVKLDNADLVMELI